MLPDICNVARLKIVLAPGWAFFHPLFHRLPLSRGDRVFPRSLALVGVVLKVMSIPDVSIPDVATWVLWVPSRRYSLSGWCDSRFFFRQFWPVAEVPGWDHTGPDVRRSDCQVFFARMGERAPDFLLSRFLLDSQNFQVPQHRERIYVAGVHRRYTRVPVQPPPALPKLEPAALWKQVLHPFLPKNMEADAPEAVKLNLLLHKAVVRRQGGWQNPVCIASDRNPCPG